MLKPSLDSLSTLVGLPRNPKIHDIGSMHRSISRFGFLERIVVNDVTGHLIGGHGRVTTLQQRKAGGSPPPDNVELDKKTGEWLIPADHVELPEDQEEAAALALNRLGEGEYDETVLVSVLADLAAQGERDGVDGLDGTGFDADDLDAILAFTAMTAQADEGAPDLDDWEQPPQAKRVIVQCDTDDQVEAVLDFLEISHVAGERRVRYNYSETALARRAAKSRRRAKTKKEG